MIAKIVFLSAYCVPGLFPFSKFLLPSLFRLHCIEDRWSRGFQWQPWRWQPSQSLEIFTYAHFSFSWVTEQLKMETSVAKPSSLLPSLAGFLCFAIWAPEPGSGLPVTFSYWTLNWEFRIVFTHQEIIFVWMFLTHLAGRKCALPSVCTCHSNWTRCPSLWKIVNHLCTPHSTPAQPNVFPSIVKRKFHECRSWDAWISVSLGGAYRRWALWLECKEPSKGISIPSYKISNYQMGGPVGG